MARRSQDRILVHNPTDEDYTIRFDSIGFIIPSRNKDSGHGLGRAVVLRYVAENYRTQMIDLILTVKMDTAVRVENERRASLGQAPMTKFIGGEEPQFTQTLRTDNKEARRKLIPIVWLGLAERYGTEAKEDSNLGKPKDDRPLDDILTDEVTRGAVAPQNSPVEDFSKKDVFTLRKIAKEKGIETEKTDKKDELIAKLSL